MDVFANLLKRHLEKNEDQKHHSTESSANLSYCSCVTLQSKCDATVPRKMRLYQKQGDKQSCEKAFHKVGHVVRIFRWISFFV